MHTPFFPSLRARFAACGARKAPPGRQVSLLLVERLFGSLIPPGLLACTEEGPNSRERVFSVRRTFWGFLYQVLNPGCACREVVRQIHSFASLHVPHLRVSEDTSAYCQARQRLPLETLQRIRTAVASHSDALLPAALRTWKGLHPKVVDGTTLSLPDTAKNQKAYPQSRAQQPGCGFPLLKLVGIFSLGSGALLDYAPGNKHEHELGLLHRILDHFRPGDLALADRGFSTYTLIALLLLRGVGCLFRLHQARSCDLRRGKVLGKNDRLVHWRRPATKPRYLPEALWNRVPHELPVRVLRVTAVRNGFRSRSLLLVTTLIDPVAYPAEEVAALYARRWCIELWFRDIKTTMGFESLRCQTPDMIHKELEMALLAYNLIRALMNEARLAHPASGERISFKGSVDAARQYSIALAQARSQKKQQQLLEDLLRVLAKDQVPERPGRSEPRAVKRRPKPFPLLTKPRHLYSAKTPKNRPLI